MAPMVLLLNATKVAGLVGAITVVANALTFRHFHRKNIAPFPDPVDESKEVLAEFPIDKEGECFSPCSFPSPVSNDGESLFHLSAHSRLHSRRGTKSFYRMCKFDCLLFGFSVFSFRE